MLLVDGMNLFLRNYAVNPTMASNGDHAGGLVGTVRGVKALVRDTSPSLAVVVWDGPGGSRRRRGILAEYKAGRKPRVNREYDFGEAPADAERNMRWQLERAHAYLGLLGVVQVLLPDVEADDVIGYVCRQVMPDRRKVVVSTDKDFLQLVDDSTVVHSPVKGITYTPHEVTRDFRCLPENFVYLKALTGDRSDNIPGLRGIGIRTAHRLIPFLSERPTDLDEIVGYVGERRAKSALYRLIADSADLLRTNVGLMQLSTPVMSAQTARCVRHALEGGRDPDAGYSPSEIRISLVRDGIQLTDGDLFSTFREYNRAARKGDEGDGRAG